MIAKLHKTSEGRTVLAVCDSDIAGKVFEEGEKQLDLSSGFFKGEEMSDERILELFKVVNIVNLNGEKAVELGKNAGIVDKVIIVEGIPHAEAVIVGEK